MSGPNMNGSDKNGSGMGVEFSHMTNSAIYLAGMTDTQVHDYYSDWARTGAYDLHLAPEYFRGPEICADFLSKYVKDKTAPILDVAAGTGRLGMVLQKMGYLTLDALEPAEGMLETARAKKIYRNYLQIPFTANNPDVPSDAYDALVISGGMAQGHIKCETLPEMARCVRKGGFIINVMREAYIHDVDDFRGRLEPKMAAMEVEGLWRRLERVIVPKYSFNKNDGVVFVFEVL